MLPQLDMSTEEHEKAKEIYTLAVVQLVCEIANKLSVIEEFFAAVLAFPSCMRFATISN